MGEEGRGDGRKIRFSGCRPGTRATGEGREIRGASGVSLEHFYISSSRVVERILEGECESYFRVEGLEDPRETPLAHGIPPRV